MIGPAVRALERAGIDAADALVVSAATGGLRRAANACRAHRKVAVLTGPGAGPAELARELFPQTPRTFVVCEDLDGPAERIVRVRPAEATTRPWHDPSVVLVLDPFERFDGPSWLAGRPPGPPGWALPAEAFTRPAPPPEVRALALAWLGPRVGDLVWDVGPAAGPVAIECARLGAAAVAVTPDLASRAAIRADVRAHGVKVAVARGALPGVLDHLPVPDAVLVPPGAADALACAAHALRTAVAITHDPGPVTAAFERAGLACTTADLGGLVVVRGDRAVPLRPHAEPPPRRRIDTLDPPP
ncbi:hypothetical protein [Actinomadura flavalba]|uniref:hypothetical protein n=1 Tax=Actinomadura flavalba TaxID=1120938 RepID=UPI00035ECEBF|nr:hypothetical protein [Actinomadura flavalba]